MINAVLISCLVAFSLKYNAKVQNTVNEILIVDYDVYVRPSSGCSSICLRLTNDVDLCQYVSYCFLMYLHIMIL